MTDSPAPTYSEGLRKLADFLDTHPEYAPWFEHELRVSGMYLHPKGREKDIPAALERFHNDLEAFGAIVNRPHLANGGGTHVNTDAILMGVLLRPLVTRGDLCTPVQVGTKQVTRKVPGPPIEVTETVPVYEWECNE